MEIKPNGGIKFTTTDATEKQAEFTEDVANFKQTQEEAVHRSMQESAQDAFDNLRGGSLLGFETSGGSGLGPRIPTRSELGLDGGHSSEPSNNAKPVPISDANQKQKLFTELRASSERAFNPPPRISSAATEKQAELNDAAANFREIEKKAKENELRRAGEEAINNLGKPFDPFNQGAQLGPSIPTRSQLLNGDSKPSEAKKPTTVPTSESYAKQKLFTELMASNKDLLDKK